MSEKKRTNELYCFRKREELIFEPFLILLQPFLLLEVNEAGFYCSAAPANALMKSSVSDELSGVQRRLSTKLDGKTQTQF